MSTKILVFLFLSLGGLVCGPQDDLDSFPWVFDVPTSDTVSFLSTKVQPKTLELYRGVWKEFLEHSGLKGRWRSVSGEQLDNAISHFLVTGFHGKELSRTHAGYLVAYLRIIWPLYKFPLSHRVFAVWRSKDAGESA